MQFVGFIQVSEFSLLFYSRKIGRKWRGPPYPDHVVDGVDVAVAGVHADGPQCEAKLFPRAVDDDGLPQIGSEEGGVPAGGRVPGGGVRGEGVRGDGAGQRRHAEDICGK